MTDDGNTIISTESTNNTSPPIVHIYKFNGTIWNHSQFTATGLINYGYLDISSDGNTVLLSNRLQNLGVLSGGVGYGRSAIFKFNGTTWGLLGGYIEGPSNLGWGYSNSLSSDGLKVAIGSSYNSSFGTNLLAPAYVKTYSLVNNVWTPYGNEIKFIFPGYTGNVDYMSFNNTGDTLITAVRNQNSTLNTKDYFMLFKYSNNEWNQYGSRINTENNFDGGYLNFGFESNVFIWKENGFLKVKDYN
jgi:hypothetical protein